AWWEEAIHLLNSALKAAGISERETCVGQRRRRDELLQFRAAAQLLDEARRQLVRGCLLHERDERLQRAEGELLRHIEGAGRSEAKIEGQLRADAGDQHASAHFRQEFTTRLPHDHGPPAREWDCEWRPRSPAWDGVIVLRLTRAASRRQQNGDFNGRRSALSKFGGLPT